eukprot:jgi/Ulvmu1/10158/UM006_0112.1
MVQPLHTTIHHMQMLLYLSSRLSRSRAAQLCNLVTGVGLITAADPICVGPDLWIPYRDRLVSSALIAVGVVAAQCAPVSGRPHLFHQSEPLRSLPEPLLTAFNEAVINIDNVIDLQMTQVVFN